MTETNRIELKRELTDELDIEKEVIAFLNNREGGIIYVGIDKDGRVVGVKDIDGDMLKIKDRIRKNISPSPMGLFDVLAENVDGTDVIKIFLASGSEKPYYKTKYGMSTRGCYIRVGTAAEPMTTEEFFNGVSNPRNKELMRVFRDVEMVEALGSGMMKVMQVYDRSCFTFMPNFTRITIKNFNATENVALNVAIELTERQRDILDLIVKNVALDVALNTTMLSDQLNVDRKTIQRDLKVLLDNNLIKREGSNRYGYWVIPNKNENEIR